MGFLDVKKFNRFTENKNYWLVDYNSSYMFIWSDYYKTEVAYDNEFAYVRLLIPEVGMCYYPPIGDGNIKYALLKIEEDARENGFDLLFTAVDETLKPILEKYGYRLLDNERFANYIYSANELAFFEGKKFKTKRNLVNKFEKLHPNAVYRRIKKEDFPIILEFIEQWRVSNLQKMDQAFYVKLNTIKKVIEHLYELDLIGIMLYDEERIYGLALGSVIGTVAYEHIEMALSDVPGAYQEILLCFARLVSVRARYINRECDNGSKAIKESNESYCPIKLERYYSTYRL